VRALGIRGVRVDAVRGRHSPSTRSNRRRGRSTRSTRSSTTTAT
jgi:hypothetical protein